MSCVIPLYGRFLEQHRLQGGEVHRLDQMAVETRFLGAAAKPREPWSIRPAKKRASVTASIQTEVETKAKELIETVLKPKHALPPPREKQGNYIIDIGAKRYRGYFYYFTTYACLSAVSLHRFPKALANPGPNRLMHRLAGRVHPQPLLCPCQELALWGCVCASSSWRAESSTGLVRW